MGEATKSAASRQGGTGVHLNYVSVIGFRHNVFFLSQVLAGYLRFLRGFRLSGGPARAADLFTKGVQKWGLNFDPILEPFWGPLFDPFGPQGGKKRSARPQNIAKSDL